jgi:hypothetical protein
VVVCLTAPDVVAHPVRTAAVPGDCSAKSREIRLI